MYQDYGLRQASATLEILATYIDAGVDEASVWGVGVNNLNSYSTMTDGKVDLSHGGVMFRWMSESVVGKSLHDGIWDNDRGDDFITYTFEDADQIVIFVAANDITAADAIVELSFDGYANFTAMRIDSLTTSTGSFDAGDPEDRLTEDVVIETKDWLGTPPEVRLTYDPSGPIYTIRVMGAAAWPDHPTFGIAFLGCTSPVRRRKWLVDVLPIARRKPSKFSPQQYPL